MDNIRFSAFGGTTPQISTTVSNLSYTSFDGKRIYLNFDDVDSTGLEPSSGLEFYAANASFYWLLLE